MKMIGCRPLERGGEVEGMVRGRKTVMAQSTPVYGIIIVNLLLIYWCFTCNFLILTTRYFF